MALGVLQAVKEAGLRVPEDVSIISNEDGILCEFATPTITAIARDKAALAQRSCELMLKRLENPQIPLQQAVVADRIVERGSVRVL